MTDINSLRNVPRPAWLWDPALRRVVWANPAAVRWFGEDHLLDLVERPFDAREPGVAALAAALKKGLPDDGAPMELSFPSAGAQALPVRVHPHALADGRPGLLVEGQAPPDGAHGGQAGLLREVLDAMPLPVAAMQASGALVYVNPAALELFDDASLGGLRAFFDDEDEARAFLKRAARAGMALTTRTGRTRLGPRDIRLTARLTSRDEDGAAELFTLLMEDVTSRRQISQALEEAAWPPLPPGKPQEPAARERQAQAENPADEEAEEKTLPAARPRLPLSAEDIHTFHRLTEDATRKEADSAVAGPVNPPAKARPADARAKPAASSARADKAEAEKAAAPAASAKSAEDQEKRTPHAIPQLVRDVLDHRSEIIILHRDEAFYYANSAAREHFGHPDGDPFWADLAHLLADAADGGEITLPGEDAQVFAVKRDVFPWRDGALMQSTLRPAKPRKGPCGPQDASAARGEHSGKAQEGGQLPSPAKDAQTQAQDDGNGKEAREPAPEPEQAQRQAQARQAPVVRIVSARDTAEQDAPQPAAEDGAHETAQDESGVKDDAQSAPLDEELRVILDTATDGIITLNRKGRILSFSAGAQALFGISLKEAVGKSFTSLMEPESRRRVEEYLAALDSGASLASIYNEGREVTARVAGGGRIPLFLTIGKMGKKGEPERDNKAAFCVVVRDITQWKETEKDLRLAKERAERSSAQKSEFLASISHELRTPLNAILGFSDVMRQQRFGEMGNEKYLGYASDIHESGEHLLSLINDLLDLSKIEAGKFELDFEAVDLAEVAASCINLMQEQAAKAHVILRRSIPPDLPKVVADARSMKQIFLNLLSNAVKFTGSGGQVMVAMKMEKSGELTASVSDTGPGMDEEELERALRPFERITTAGQPEQPGTGLGLPLTKALVEANHARFAISSKPGQGTTVRITFPTPRVLA